MHMDEREAEESEEESDPNSAAYMCGATIVDVDIDTEQRLAIYIICVLQPRCSECGGIATLAWLTQYSLQSD